MSYFTLVNSESEVFEVKPVGVRTKGEVVYYPP